MADTTEQGTGTVLLALFIVWLGLWCVLTWLRRRRPGFDIRGPIAVAVAVRLIGLVAVNATGAGAQLRGGDETTFLDFAQQLAMTPWGHGFWPHGIYQLQTVIFAIEMKAASFTPTAIRVIQVGIATLGLIMLAAAVWDIAGPRAARRCAWILAFEPANVFFSSEIHKEPLMFLATGLVVFGATKIWRRLDIVGGVVPIALGAVIAIETRSYAGWFLVIAAVAVLVHAAVRRLDRPAVAMPIVYGVVIAAFLLAPTMLRVTDQHHLHQLQDEQGYTSEAQASTNVAGGSGQDNLALEQVNLSTRGNVFASLPLRMVDLVFRPYPWQLEDASQQLGALGTMLAFGGLVLLVRWGLRARSRLLDLVPIVYPMFFLWVAYSLSAGNAGTGFRYRTHIVMLGAAALAVVREYVVEQAEAETETPAAGSAALSWYGGRPGAGESALGATAWGQRT